MKNDLNIRDEEILLLGLCRLSFDAELTVMLKALTEQTKDWNYFSSLANIHGVSALVYSNLERLDFLSLIPLETVNQLRSSLMISLTRNARNIESMALVMMLLNRKGIKTLLLKGLALELSVYGNSGLRQMTDVDLLVSREDCMKARRILIENGFSSMPVKSLFHKAILADIGKHLPTLIKNGFRVEIHHELFGAGKNVLTKMLYESSRETDIKGEKVFIPQPQIFFLYLIKHLYLHEMNNESQLRLYADLVVLIEKYREEILNYNLLVYAKQAGMEEILAWRIEPLRDLLGIPFPGWLNEFINKWYNPASINKFVFFLKSPKDNPVENKALLYRHRLHEIPGLHRKFLFLLGDLFPYIEFMKKRYGCNSRWRAILYYPHRLGKIWYIIKGVTV